MTQKHHKNYLKFTAFVVGSFGPIFFLGTMLTTSEPARWTLDYLSWPIDGVQTYEAPQQDFYQRLQVVFSLVGAFVFGVYKNGFMILHRRELENLF
jgi:hypothetical protein